MRGIAEYKTVDVESASREQLVVMLMEAAIRRQHQAIAAIEAENSEEGRAHLQRAREIYAELAGSLDHAVQPEMCNNLHRLYSWCIAELGRASRECDSSVISTTIKVSQVLYEAWEHVAEQAGQ
ncbi:MAG: flagellar export chaperone FliS [Myxococcota bacterium]|nr:flagellar export chaperone FliS [Myxococcota bacterium]